MREADSFDSKNIADRPPSAGDGDGSPRLGDTIALGGEIADAPAESGGHATPITVSPLSGEVAHASTDLAAAFFQAERSTLTGSSSPRTDHLGSEPGLTVATSPSEGYSTEPDVAGADAIAPSVRRARPVPAIAGYEILGELGRGGMGIVYHARQVRLNRPCALKMILAGAHADAVAATRFLAEATAIARLRHPNVVQIHHIGEADGLPYFELEYLEGGGLDRRLDGTPWPSRRAAGLVEPLALAIAEAHRLGLVHRDLKPANVLLAADGTPKITDFGLVKWLAADSRVTATDSIMGSPSYMAPEQAEGHTDRVGPAADVYALGAILYELLTGRPPFRAATVLETLDQVRRTEPVPPTRLVPGLPRDAETLCLKCLEKDPSKRYGSADALAEDLLRFLEDRPIRSRPTPGYERSWRWCRRNPALASLIGLAATLTVLVAVVSTVAALVSIRQLDRTRKAERQTQLALGKSTTAERQARLALGKSLLSEGAALQRTGLIGQRFDSLDRLAGAAKVLSSDREGRDRLPEIRYHAIAALGLTDLRVLWQRDHGDIYSFSVDAALERYAVAERSGTVVVYRLDDHRELVRLPAPEQRRFWHVETLFSPDGELLVAVYVGSGGGGNLLQVWHLGRQKLLASLQSRGVGAFYGGAFSPDSRRFLFCPPEGGIDVWDRGERRVVRRLPLDFPPHYLAIDPEGRRLAVNNADAPARVAILELESGRVLADWRSQVGNTSLAWSADGQLLAIGSGSDSRVYVWNARRGELASVLSGNNSYIINVRFAHSGHLLATTSWENVTRLWDAASGELLATAPGQEIGFAQDDHRLAYKAGGVVGVWEVASGDECRTLHPAMLGNRSERRDATQVLSGAFSPDGRLLATGDADGVRLWEADTGREVAHLKDRRCEDVLFHPDGKSLISSGQWGLYRWPIVPDPEHGAQSLRVGPPELLREAGGAEWNKASWLPDYRTVALVDNSQARVLLVDSSHPHPAWSQAAALDSGENRRMNSVAVSPDGRWLAVGGWKEAGIRVWDLRRRRLERLLRPNDPVRDMTFLVGFSPDGRWLTSCTISDQGTWYEFWHTGTWDLGQERQGGGFYPPPVYTGDGRLMALGITGNDVMLADGATGREVVRLTVLKGSMPLAFSPDNTKLVAATGQKAVLVWDLRRIRDRLASLGLDWDAPIYPASTASVGGTAAGPVQPLRHVRVVGEVLETQARRRVERGEMDRRLGANPDDAEALIHRGWLSLTERRLPEAIADLDHLHRQQPDYPDVERMLGQAYQDMGNLAAAPAFSSRVLERTPEDQEFRFERGMLAFAAGLTQQAADDFTRVLAADPTRDLARYHRARALNRMGRYPEASADLDALIGRNPKDFMLYELRGTAHEALGEHEPAGLDRVKARALLPRSPNLLNNQAWGLVTGSFAQRDPERAVLLARQAIALAPDQSIYLNTLGVALYRAGKCAEAVDVLERSLGAGRGGFDAFDLFFLAMAHHDLGHPERALTCFDRAVNWMEGNKKLEPQYIQELNSFRAEAKAVLAGSGGDLPADVFAPR